LSERIKSDAEVSGDLQIVEGLESTAQPLEMVAFNAPLTAPKCVRCELKCPGFEVCTEPEIQWMWNHYRNRTKKKNSKARLFTPYTERCAEQWLMTELEEDFQIQHGLGANMAPLFARARFLARRMKVPVIEVNPKVSLWRIGQSLNVQKSHLRFHRHSVGGDEARAAILMALVKQNIAFLYEQDVRHMVQNGHAFDAFICALTAVLKTKGQCETRPKDFPKDEAWIDLPSTSIIW
jgi:predicted nuclease with RNAse H fold